MIQPAEISFFERISFWTLIRAAIVLTAPIGYAFTAARFAAFCIEYLFLNAVSAVTFLALAMSLNAPLRQLPACVVMIVFLICYYLEFYLMVTFPWLIEFVPLPPNILGFSEQYYFACFCTMTAGLAAFAAVVIPWSRRLGRRRLDSRAGRPVRRFHAAPALCAAGALAAGYLWFNLSYNIVNGGSVPVLAFHLFGVVEFSFSITATLLFLMIIDAATEQGDWRTAAFAATIWLAPLFCTAFIITSKGAIFTFLLDLFFLWLLAAGRLNWRVLGLGILGFATGAVLFPVINAVRALRVDEGMSAGRAISVVLTGAGGMTTAIRDVGAGKGGAVLPSMIALILGRLSGANTLLPIMELRYPFLGMNSFHIAMGTHGIPGYFTSQMLGLGDLTASRLTAALGMLGFFWIIGGNAMVIVGVAGFTSMILAAWHFIPRHTGRSTRAAQVTLLMVVLGGAVDGSLQQFVLHVLPFWAVSVALAEWIGRGGEVRRAA